MKLFTALLGALLLTVPSAAAHPPRPSAPSAAQIRAAVRAAKRSSKLWATINVCNSLHHPNEVGIRGQMPALGFVARLRMVFGVDYWDSAHGGGFKPLPGIIQPADGGIQVDGTWQSGVLVRFNPHTGLLRGRVTFEWSTGSRTIARVQELTRSGHADARYSDPSGFSSWRCVLP